VHERVCRSHIGGQSLASKIIRARFFLATLRDDAKYDKFKCMQSTLWAPTERLYSLVAPWPFHRWRVNILGSFLISIRQLKFIVAIECGAIDYYHCGKGGKVYFRVGNIQIQSIKRIDIG